MLGKMEIKMQYETLEVDLQQYVAVVKMNRPDRMNALNETMESELRLVFETMDKNESIRAIVLTGEGRAFCAGMDIDQVADLAPDDIRDQKWMRSYDMNRRSDYQARYAYFGAISKPIIVAINGATAGLGLILSLYADVRFCSENAVFSTAFAKRGLIAEHGIAWILPQVVGYPNAIDLLLSSRKIDSAEALKMGLVSKVIPAKDILEHAITYAKELSELVSPRSTRIMKRQLRESPFQTLSEAIAMANDEMWKSLQSEDFKEGVKHFVEKRKPQFSGV